MPSNHKQTPVRLYVKDGKDLHFITNVNRRIANYLSPAIREQLKAGGGPVTRMEWSSRLPSSIQLTLEHVGSDNFSQLLHVYLAGYHLGIARSIRGDVLYNIITNHVSSAQLSANEFKLVHQLTGFSPSVFTKLLHHYVATKISGTPFPQHEQIEQYCDEAGLRRRLNGIERHILKGN
ncbi:hypothetical protein M409DRAFT_22164 [Zasmidium cellare ATCC 36951]|uniref:BTB domain-containing protein n=1 Tax=Zasmidium cellare ATCC 36951 TaxID=1080233 RepID=A0A6A6CJD9_ZASCE|nr:uncharacterized protein M409DRAFT_22164 [Zasmidium cellare ATCC 36951]KAF2167354.1 hypothetical protein M409DRAFT_22164 [Zasmidium cellare ATCC 36951]